MKITESKLGSTSAVSYPPELLTAMKGMFTTNKVYSFQLHASGTIQSSGGGVLSTRISWDATVTSFAEYSALSALFDEVVITSAQVDITSAFGPTSTAIIVQFVIAPDRTATGGATPTFTPIQRLAESEVFHCYNMAAKTGVFTKVHNIGPRPFAAISVAASGSATTGGVLGQFSIASNIVGTATTNYIFWVLRPVYKFRCRA